MRRVFYRGLKMDYYVYIEETGGDCYLAKDGSYSTVAEPQIFHHLDDAYAIASTNKNLVVGVWGCQGGLGI